VLSALTIHATFRSAEMCTHRDLREGPRVSYVRALSREEELFLTAEENAFVSKHTEVTDNTRALT